ADRVGTASRRRIQSSLLRRRHPESLPYVAVGGNPDRGGTTRKNTGLGTEQLASRACSDRIPAFTQIVVPVHHGLDQPLDVPAGDRIHGSRPGIGVTPPNSNQSGVSRLALGRVGSR